MLASTPDLTKLNLEDKEFILANGTKDDAQKLWAVLQNQATPVPGVVIDAPASVLKISVTTTAAVKPKDYVVKLTTPVACATAPAAPADAKVRPRRTILLPMASRRIRTQSAEFLLASAQDQKLTVEPAVGTINVAVTQDAKDNKVADFIVNLKEPVSLQGGSCSRLRIQAAARR